MSHTTPTPEAPSGMASGTPTRRVLAEVHAERIRQDEKWGQQNHPDLYLTEKLDRIDYAHQAALWKFHNNRRVGEQNSMGVASDRNAAWDGILLKEVFEALAEEDPAALRAELIQVAGVAVAWIEAIDRRSATCVCISDCPEDPTQNPCPVCRALDPYEPCPVVGFGDDETEVSR